jgi:putative copper export protein
MMPLAAALKASAYLGTMLLVGGAVSVMWLAPTLVRGEVDPAGGTSAGGRGRTRRAFGALVLLGAVVLVAASLFEVVNTLREVLGRVDADLMRRYLASTLHGRVVRERWWQAALVAVTTTALAFWPDDHRGRSGGGSGDMASAHTSGRERTGTGPPQLELGPRSWWRRRLPTLVRAALSAVAACASLALMYGFARLSHAAAMGGSVPLGADFTHLLAAGVWAGPLGYLALLTPGEGGRAALAAAVKRLSSVGALAVAVLAVTGTYSALGHMAEPAAFATSPYGTALWVKLGLFALVVVAAAFNRFRHLPRFLAGGPVAPLRRALRLEAALLAALLVVTGALTTSPVPHAGGDASGALANLLHLIDLLRR